MVGAIRKIERAWGLRRRYAFTLAFVSETLPPGSTIFDLGTENALGRFFSVNGYTVKNSGGEDFDLHPEAGAASSDAVTAFEILEHLVNPLGVLAAIRAPRLFVTVPLRLWFARAYRNPKERWDQHFHEFEDWQLDWLLEKAGWKIVRRKKWTSPSFIPGIRGVLRLLTYRYYAVEAIRQKDAVTGA